MDLRLTNYDVDLTDLKLSFVTGAEAVAQHVTMRLRTWLGEVDVYDTTAGVPYVQVIFATKNPNLNAIRFILERNILATPGVQNVSLELSLDTSTRVLSVRGTLRALDEEIDFFEEING